MSNKNPHPSLLPAYREKGKENDGPGTSHQRSLIRNRTTRTVVVLIAWMIAMAIACALDARVAGWVRQSGVESFIDSHKHLRALLKTPGEYWFTVLMIAIAAVHRTRWRASVLVFVGTLVSGVNGLTKWMVGRTRPFKLHTGVLEPFSLEPFRGGLPGLFKSSNLCFPSGHAALAFATAAALVILWPRGRWGFYLLATMVAVERVSENAHWLSDNVAAAALGIGGVWLVRRFWWDRLPPNVNVLKPL